MIIYFDATTEQLEKALPFTKGGWKPYSTPVFTQEELAKHGTIDLTKDIDKYKFKFPTPHEVSSIHRESK